MDSQFTSIYYCSGVQGTSLGGIGGISVGLGLTSGGLSDGISAGGCSGIISGGFVSGISGSPLPLPINWRSIAIFLKLPLKLRKYWA